MLDSIYHMTLKLIKKHIFGVKMSRFCYLLRNFIMAKLCNVKKSKTVVVYRFYCMVLYHSQTRLHVIKPFIFFQGVQSTYLITHADPCVAIVVIKLLEAYFKIKLEMCPWDTEAPAIAKFA